MASGQLTGIVINVAIYAALIVFILYRQMSARPLRATLLVLIPLILAVFATQQLSGARATFDAQLVAILGINIGLSVVLGLWRGTTFRLWVDAGTPMIKGTALTLVTWGVLIATRLPSAFISHAAHYSQGFIVGELLLALCVTFAAQNVVIWARAARVPGVATGVR